MIELIKLVEKRIEELKDLVEGGQRLGWGFKKVRGLQEMLQHNRNILNTLQRAYYEKTKVVPPTKNLVQ